jgi:hypothetical protein
MLIFQFFKDFVISIILLKKKINISFKTNILDALSYLCSLAHSFSLNRGFKRISDI